MGHYETCLVCGEEKGMGGCACHIQEQEETREERLTRLTNEVIAEIGQCSVEEGLTVLCNLAGQLVAQLSAGKLNDVPKHAVNVGQNVQRVAMAKLIHDDDERRKGD